MCILCAVNFQRHSPGPVEEERPTAPPIRRGAYCGSGARDVVTLSHPRPLFLLPFFLAILYPLSLPPSYLIYIFFSLKKDCA